MEHLWNTTKFDYYTQKNIMVITICDNYIPHYYSHGDFDKEGSVLRLSYSRLVIHIRRRLVIQDEWGSFMCRMNVRIDELLIYSCNNYKTIYLTIFINSI